MITEPAQTETTETEATSVPQSNEVTTAEAAAKTRAEATAKKRAKEQAAAKKKGGSKTVLPPAKRTGKGNGTSKPKAKAAGPKYGEELKSQAKRAEALRGKPRSCGPVQIQRLQAQLGSRKPMDMLKGMTIAQAKDYAAGDTGVKPSDTLAAFSAELSDPFTKGRGAAAILLALAGK